ncbi:MAG TPA: sulfatase [Candidatus Binatia bacterium]|nr:sulfatase [Candidatus Binatia bacterium]
MSRRVLVLASVAAGTVVALAVWLRPRGTTLPPHLTLEEVVADLSGEAATAADLSGGTVSRGPLQPGDPLRGDGARVSLLTPVPSRLGFRVDVPSGGALRFSIGVEGPGRRESGRSGILFSVRVDSREVWTRTVNPATSRHDRRWFDERVDLADAAGRPVDVVLATEAERKDLPLAGKPGWTHVRLVREVQHDRQSAGAGAPNVIVLLVDTLRADRLGCYGARPSASPTLDRLAAQGTVFEEMIAQASWTMPAVASVFTGLHPRSHGALGDIRHPRGDDRQAAAFLPDAVDTWAKEAARAGITTIGVSANPLVSRSTNLAQGFETFVDLPWDPEGRNWPAADEVNRAFIDWLTRNRAHRFLAYLHYMEPHDPYTPPSHLRPAPPPGIRPAVAAGWVRDLADAVNWGGAPLVPREEVEYLRALYTGEVRAWDESLARLVDSLGELGVRDSTVFVVTGDHGEEFEEHGHLTHGTHLYEESLRVPLVIAGPGIATARRPDVAQGIDLFPTLAGLLGIEAPRDLPGRNLLVSQDASTVISETARSITPDGSPMEMIAVRAGGWKLIVTPELGRAELYDLTHDAEEHDDRSGGGPEQERLASLLAHWETTAPVAARPEGYDPALRTKLRALGYVQ